MIRKWCNQKEIPTKNTEMGKNKINNQVLILRKHIVSLVNSFFSKKVATQLPKLNLKYENVRKVLKAQKFKPKT